MLISLMLGCTFLLAFLILINANKLNVRANKWLSLFFLLLFGVVLDHFYTIRYPDKDGLWLNILGISNFLIAPMLYLSIYHFVNPFKQFNRSDYLHFAFPFLLLVLILIEASMEDKQPAIDVKSEYVINIVFRMLFSIPVLLYCIFSYLKIITYQKNIVKINSSTDNKTLKWLQNIIIGFVLMAFLWVLDFLFELSLLFPLVDETTNFIHLIGILYFTFHWTHQKELFPLNLQENNELNEILTDSNYQEVRVKLDLINVVEREREKLKLNTLMHSERPYLNPELNLFELAAKLNISAHLLSHIINQGFGQNFNAFINLFRVEEAKRLIVDDKLSHLSLLGIGYEAGFNSKTSFNTTFKKFTGLTPSEYRKQFLNAKTGSIL